MQQRYATPDDRPYCGGVLTVREWREMREAWGHRCAYCGSTRWKLVPEHVEPLSRGGANVRENIVPACRSCNSSKSDLFLMEWVMAREGPCKRVAQNRKYPKGLLYFDQGNGLLPSSRFIAPRAEGGR